MANPIITHKFTADPTAIVFNDTIYLYTGRDEAPAGESNYVMNEWLCFSSSDLRTWREHPVNFKPQSFSWGKSNAYASKVIHWNNKFYWYVALTPKQHSGKAIGVAVSDSPSGPFKDARGSALVNTTMFPGLAGDNFDPSVLVDDDGQAYLFWGKDVCYYAKLSKDLVSVDGDITRVDLPDFIEGIHIHKRNDWYYLSYGYGYPEKVGYAMSRNIAGPWEFKGILNELAGNCVTNRPCVIDFRGQSYFLYHNGGLPGGGSHRRSVCIDRLHYNPDGTMKRIIMTSEGV